jgi:hypothetical protein
METSLSILISGATLAILITDGFGINKSIGSLESEQKAVSEKLTNLSKALSGLHDQLNVLSDLPSQVTMLGKDMKKLPTELKMDRQCSGRMHPET